MSLFGTFRRVTEGWRFDDAALAGRNNFHLVRLLAALLVLFAHAFHLLEQAGDEPVGAWFVWLDSSLLGVAIFFFVSGFLVSHSWHLRGNLPSFLVARALRITPGLWLALAATVFILGPVVTMLPLTEYFGAAQLRLYLVHNAVLDTKYLLPGVFETNPVRGVNGSLWTIPLEVVLYVVLGIAGWLGLSARSALRNVRRRIAERPLIANAMIFVAVLLIAKVMNTGPQYYRLAGYFLLGALCYRFRNRFVLRIDVALALVVAAIACARMEWGAVLLPFALAYAILVFALHPAFRMSPTWLHRHDYSYGTYLYGFPVEQSLILAGVTAPWPLFGCAIVATLACASISWHCVEKPALDLKPRAAGLLQVWSVRHRSA